MRELPISNNTMRQVLLNVIVRRCVLRAVTCLRSPSWWVEEAEFEFRSVWVKASLLSTSHCLPKSLVLLAERSHHPPCVAWKKWVCTSQGGIKYHSDFPITKMWLKCHPVLSKMARSRFGPTLQRPAISWELWPIPAPHKGMVQNEPVSEGWLGWCKQGSLKNLRC